MVYILDIESRIRRYAITNRKNGVIITITINMMYIYEILSYQKIFLFINDSSLLLYHTFLFLSLLVYINNKKKKKTFSNSHLLACLSTYTHT